MTDQPSLSAPATTVMVGGKPIPLADAEKTIKGSGSWFWWVAGLSIANSVAAMLELKYGMILGLGLGQFIDAMFFYDAEGNSLDPSLLARGVHLFLTACVVGVFVILGWFARRFSVAAFVTGMVLYALDALLFVLVGDWVAVGFHAFVLFMLWGGLSVLRLVRAQTPAVAQAAA
jgi:hypothetical protein